MLKPGKLTDGRLVLNRPRFEGVAVAGTACGASLPLQDAVDAASVPDAVD
jgi:hypothetical protein